MKLKPWQKSLLSMIIIIIGGFILFNFAFILTALVVRATMFIIRAPENMPPPHIGRYITVILILIMSYIVFRSRLNDTIKATYLTMPLMVALVMIGLSLYGKPQWVIYGTGALVIFAVTFYLYKKKLSWLYYFSTFYVAILGLYIMISGMEI